MPAAVLSGLLLLVSANAQQSSLLGPRDRLSFNIQEDPIVGTVQEILVSSTGQARFPVSRGFPGVAVTVDAAGKNLEQVASEVKAKLDETYYHDATLELQVKERAQRTAEVYFTGEAKASFTTFDASNPPTIFEALTKVGYSEYANLKKVTINRADPVTGQTHKITVNLKKIKDGDRSGDIKLMDGDRVEVPEKFFNLFGN